MLRQKRARVQRNLNVGRMWQRTTDRHELTLTGDGVHRHVAGHLHHLVRGALDVDAATTRRQRALEAHQQVTMLGLGADNGLIAGSDVLSAASVLQNVAQLGMIALVAVLPHLLADHVDL